MAIGTRMMALGICALLLVSIWIGLQIGHRDPIAWVFVLLIPGGLLWGLVYVLRRTHAADAVSMKKQVDDLSTRLAALEATVRGLLNKR